MLDDANSVHKHRGHSSLAMMHRAESRAPGYGRALHRGQESFARRYSITWSARSSSDGGMVRPSAFAVLASACCIVKLRGDWPAPDDTSPHRQPNGIVSTVPTEKSLELVIELLSASGLQSCTRETVPRMERLDVAIDGLAIPYGIGLGSPGDNEQSSSLQFSPGVVR